MSVDVEQLLLAQQLRLAKMQSSMTARQLRLIEAAMLEIAAKLSGPGAGTWGHAERMATMQMLARSLQQMTTTQLGALTLDLRRVSWLAKTDTATYLATLDKHFTGSVHPLRFDTLSWWEGTQKNIGRVRLREYSRSFQRYGAAITRDIEDILAKTILVGEPWTEARDKVWAATRTVINKNDYRIDRIIRTECLLPDTLVSGAVVRAASRRWYEGAVVEVITERGRKFTTTPNHPMLSRRGWVGTGELSEGDDLVCYVGKQHASSTSNKDVAAPPATISEIFDSIAAVGVSERRAGAEPDFHGDGRDSNVDVSYPAGELGLGHFAAIGKPLAEKIFAPSDEMCGATFCSCCGGLFSTDGVCLCLRPEFDTHFSQPSLDGTIADAPELSTEGVHAFAGEVSGADLTHGQVVPGLWMGEKVELELGRIGHGALDPEPGSLAGCSPARNSGRSLDAPRAEPADVELDRVIELRLSHYSGHVYNLSTAHGYFAINGAVTGNTSAAWNGTTQAALLEEDEPDDPMFKKLITHFDIVTGRDSVMLHGQTRPVKKPFYDAVNGISYMAPPNRPNDREIVVGWRKRYGDHFDDFDKELSDGYDPEIHGPRKVLQSGKAVDPTGPMTRARPKRRKPLHFKPTERKRREQLSRLESERSALMDQLKRTKAQVHLLKRQANLFTGEHGTLIGDSAATTAEMAKTLTRQVEERTQWIQALRAGY